MSVTIMWHRHISRSMADNMGRKRHQVDTYRVEELQQFTDNYQDKLGEGVFGVVYKGTCKDGKLIAVKVLKERWVKNQQNEFKRELEILKTIMHPNIIELVGFCYQVGNKCNNTTSGVHQIGAALCFEYASHGSLKPYISGDALDWRTRYGIIKGTCEGLKYLYHDHPSGKILHRDLKPDNILLDDDMVPKIADFGAAELYNDQTAALTNIFGAASRYAPPEFRNKGLITETCDIFGLGVIIMEIVAGPGAYDEIDDMSHQEAIELVCTKWRDMVDRIRLYQVITCLELAKKCAHIESNKRPGIKDVLEKLNEVEKMVPEEKTENNQGTKEGVKCKQGKKGHVREEKLHDTIDSMEIKSHHTCIASKAFVHEHVKKITNNFSVVLGEGSHGIVYKAIYEDGKEAAVKVLCQLPEGSDKEELFRTQLQIRLGLRHQNIIQLVGCCYEVGPRKNRFTEKTDTLFLHAALCYEYAPNGNLAKYITDEGDGLDWHTCYKIIRGTCEGLSYLHNHPSGSILHLALKPENILLTGSMVPKIGDFGMSTIFGYRNTKFEEFLGASYRKYMSIEFKRRAIISIKYDIYSLGVIILELVAGSAKLGENVRVINLPEVIDHILQKWSHRVEETFLCQVKTCLEIALRCVQDNRHERPTTSEITAKLIEVENMILKDNAASRSKM
ncbi:hypothetical protein ZWY2020_018551 [Hordeum vulgare]|nr:hypothetical protein ZWY2020_018551 [Hordeum vulgare]